MTPRTWLNSGLKALIVLPGALLMFSSVNPAIAQHSHSQAAGPHEEGQHDSEPAYLAPDMKEGERHTSYTALMALRKEHNVTSQKVDWIDLDMNIAGATVFSGDGEKVQKDDKVYIHLKAYSEKGKEVYNTFKERIPVSFYFGMEGDRELQVEELEAAITGMRQGGKRLVVMPRDLGLVQRIISMGELDEDSEWNHVFFETSLYHLTRPDMSSQERFNF